MALLSGNINYSGKFLTEILTESFAETLFHKNFGARVNAGFKCKWNFHTLDTAGELTEYEVCPTSFPEMTLDQKSGDMCNFQFLKQVTHNDLVCSAREIYLKQGFNAERALDDTVFIEAVTNSIIKVVANNWDNVIINGDAIPSPTNQLEICDGLLVQWLADGTVIDINSGTPPASITAGTFTPSNVITELNKVYSKIPSKLKYHSDPLKRVKIGVSIDIADAYAMYLTQQGSGFNFYDPTQPGVMKYLGLDIVPLNWLPTSTMFATYADNIALFYDGDTDFGMLEIWDLSLSQPCDIVRMRIKFRGAVSYGYGSEVVLYIPA